MSLDKGKMFEIGLQIEISNTLFGIVQSPSRDQMVKVDIKAAG